MKIPNRPFVLIVDDDPDSRSPLARSLGESLDVEITHPNDVSVDQIADADLILVDLVLKDWSARDKLEPVALQPLNGVALTSVLRAHAETNPRHSPAFALLSGRLGTLSPNFPPEPRLHILAQNNNLEWVFQKGEIDSNIPQIIALATAIKKLPRSWDHTDPEGIISQLRELLGPMEDMPDYQLALEDLERCHPPIHEFSESSHGLALVRWFLHRILPYPTFLIDPTYLAARLRVDPEKLAKIITSDKEFRDTFKKVEYSGMLATFLGVRWWRAGVESLIWELTDGQPHIPQRIHEALENRGVQGVDRLPVDQEVVCIDAEYQPLPKLYTMDETVRVQPDPWPPYADQACALIEDVCDDRALRALVIRDDWERL